MARDVLAILLFSDESVASSCLLKVLGDTAVSRLIRQLSKFGADGFTVISNIRSRRVEEEISRILERNPDLKLLNVDEARSISWKKVAVIPANLVSDSETVRKLMSLSEGLVLSSSAESAGKSNGQEVRSGTELFLFASLEGQSGIALEILEGNMGANDIVKAIVSVGLKRVRPQELSSYSPAMKTLFEPFFLLLGPNTSIYEVEQALVKRVQKGKHLTSLMNKPIEDFLSLRAARLGVTPGQMTILSNVLAYSAAMSMLLNQVVLSVSLMLITCIVDGLDGKIARLRSMESNFGSLEHSFDFLYEQVWYGSYVWYLFVGLRENIWLALGICALVVDAFVRHLYNQFRITAGIALTDSSPTAKLVAKFDGRRNMYVIYILVGLLFNTPALGLVLMASHASLTALLYLTLARSYLCRSAQTAR